MSSDRPSAELKRLVTARARGCCEYCLSLRSFSASPFVIEHILPDSAGGLTEEGNLCLACSGCNGHKHAATGGWDLVTEKEHRLYHPRTDDWRKHFAWSPDGLLIVGLTAIGRATVNRLHLNRKEVVNLREVLARDGVHPPDYDYGQ